VNRHLHLVPETAPPTGTAATTKKGAVKKAASAKASGKSQEEASVDRPPAQFWRTTGYTRLAVPLNGVLGGKTAKAFESLKLRTVGDLMLHLPRRYVSGTELSDLANLVEGDDVTVLAQVRQSSVHGMSQSARGAGKFRLQAVITDMTDVSASVVVSPTSRPSATSRSRRRMILPDRVFGSSPTT
jgi:hypothetical protein